MLLISLHSLNSFSIILAKNIYHDPLISILIKHLMWETENEEFLKGWFYIDTAILGGSTVRYRIYASGRGKWAPCAAGLRNGAGQTAGIQEAEFRVFV